MPLKTNLCIGKKDKKTGEFPHKCIYSRITVERTATKDYKKGVTSLDIYCNHKHKKHYIGKYVTMCSDFSNRTLDGF